MRELQVRRRSRSKSRDQRDFSGCSDIHEKPAVRTTGDTDKSSDFVFLFSGPSLLLMHLQKPLGLTELADGIKASTHTHTHTQWSLRCAYGCACACALLLCRDPSGSADESHTITISTVSVSPGTQLAQETLSARELRCSYRSLCALKHASETKRQNSWLSMSLKQVE